MIPLINQAMVIGYTASQILSFIGNKIPGMQQGLSSAKQRGYTDEDILKFLQNKIPQKDPEGSKKYSNSLDTYLSSNGIQTKEERTATRNKGIKTALGAAGTALTAYKAYQNYSGIFDQVKDYFKGETPGDPNTIEQPTPVIPPEGPDVGGPQTPPYSGPALTPASKSQSLFQRLLGGLDLSKIDAGTAKQLQFLGPLADKLEKQGKKEGDVQVEKLKKKIQQVLRGKIGSLDQEVMEMDPGAAIQTGAQVQQPQQGQFTANLMGSIARAQKLRGGGG